MRRRPKRPQGHISPVSEPSSALLGTDVFAPRPMSRQRQIEVISRDIAAIDELPARIRSAFRRCDFDIEYAVQMRFARQAERSGMSDDDVAKAIGRIKTFADAEMFRKLWGSS